MAEYRRFISYMYLYENGRKAGNSGFVRVESRNSQCRVHIHMTGLYGPEDAVYTVYMLIRETGGYIGIVLGPLEIQQQNGERDLVTDSSRLMETDYDLNRVSGMVVLGSDGRIYGTRWDDEPLETECFERREVIGGNLVLFYLKERQQMPEITEETAAEIQEEEEAVREVEVPVADDPVVNEEIVAEPAAEENIEAVHQEMETEPTVLEISKTGQEDQENPYERLIHRYPQMYPFDDDSVEICVRLDLQDIGLLPMQCWLFGSNSFLLHSYYCYRHLILAKMQSRSEEKVYLLGVPGLYKHRERYMAEMFGFKRFKPVSRENSGNGAFGYWLIPLNI